MSLKYLFLKKIFSEDVYCLYEVFDFVSEA